MPSKQQLLDLIAIQTEIAKLGLDLDGTMDLVVERVMPLLGADGAAVELADGIDMVYRATSGIARAQLGLHVAQPGSLSGLCVERGEILICKDAENDPRVNVLACRQVGLRSMLVAPLKYCDENVGVLKVMSTRIGHFKRDDVQLVALLCEVIGAALYYANRYGGDALFRRATQDAMTGLTNRALFEDRMRRLIDLHQRNRQSAVVLVIDMDGLKHINDTFGHRAGDAVITEFARRLKDCARQTDTVARLGGDEFGLILSPIEVPQGLEAILRRLNAATGQPFEFEGRIHRLGASMGAAVFPVDADDIDHLLETADRRMYQTKRRRNGGTASFMQH